MSVQTVETNTISNLVAGENNAPIELSIEVALDILKVIGDVNPGQWIDTNIDKREVKCYSSWWSLFCNPNVNVELIDAAISKTKAIIEDESSNANGNRALTLSLHDKVERGLNTLCGTFKSY